VIDVQHQRVVRGRAGERNSYQENQSCLVGDADPVLTAIALQQAFDTEHLYVADLDGIVRGQPNSAILSALVKTGVRIVADTGANNVAALNQLLSCGINRAVISVESCSGLTAVQKLTQHIAPQNFCFSLDLKNGQLLNPAWDGLSPIDIAQEVIAMGITSMIVLDLATVGTGNGITTSQLCAEIREHSSQLNLWTGGGIRSVDDLENLRGIADGVLVASALHDGSITPEQWLQFQDH